MIRRIQIKKVLCLMLLLILCFALSGCWNYRDLDTLDIVSGIAVDRDPESDKYLLTFEIIDTASAGDDEIGTIYVESEGETIFDAIRNSKRRLINKLYGGNLQAMIISHQIAEAEGVDVILEELLRDGEPRETMSIAISQQDTAREILLTEGIDSKIIAYEIHDMIMEDSEVTASTKDLPLYQAYRVIHGTGNSLVLPVVRCVQNNDETVVQSNGIALFRGNRLVGFESPENTMLYLFVVNELHGASLSFPVQPGGPSISLEVKGSRTQTSVDVRDGQVHVSIDIAVKLNVTELKSQLDITDMGQRSRLETLTAQVLEERVSAYFQSVQTSVQFDIFGLGRKVYQQDAALWAAIADDWDAYFQNATVKVSAKADILTSGVLKQY